MSSTFCAHWSTFITFFKFFLKKLEKVDSAQLSLWANRLCANVLFEKLKASVSFDLLSNIFKQWYACEQSSLQKNFLPARC